MGIVEQRRLRPTIHQGRAGDATFRGRHGPRRRRIALLVVLASSALVLAEAASAAAATSIAGEPVMATDVVVGTVRPASVRIVNTSSDNSGDNIALETITLIPSCANLDLDCAGGAQPGVFSMGSMATGESLTACAGRSFTVTTVDPTTGKRAFTPTGGPVELGPPGSSISQCRINFDVSVVQVPSVDSNPGVPGVQTNSIFFARGTRGGLRPGSSSASGSGQTTVRAAPALETTASPSALVGAQIQDTAGCQVG